MNKSKIFGVFLIVGSIMMLLSGMDIIADFNMFKVFGSIFLVYILIESIFKGKYSMIVFSIAFLAIMFASELEIEAISPWPIFFAAGMISVGMNIIGVKDRKSKFKGNFNNRWGYNWDKRNKSYYKDSNDYEDYSSNSGSVINETVSFTESVRYINSQDFKTANIKTSFASAILYFDNAIIKESAHVNLNLNFGEVKMYVPKHWNVVVNTSQFMAGVEINDRYANHNENSPTLYINGSVAFGGLEINYV